MLPFTKARRAVPNIFEGNYQIISQADIDFDYVLEKCDRWEMFAYLKKEQLPFTTVIRVWKKEQPKPLYFVVY